MSYVGRKFGMHCDTLEDASHVDQLLAVVTDAVAEGRMAFHPLNHTASHKGQACGMDGWGVWWWGVLCPPGMWHGCSACVPKPRGLE